MFRKFHVKKDERALLFWKGDFAEILRPGEYVRFDPLRRLAVEKFALAKTRFEHRLADFLVKAEPDLVAREFHVVELGATEVGLRYENDAGRLTRATATLATEEGRRRSLAEIYRALL